MLKYNWKTMRYEVVGDTRPDLLADKLDMESFDGFDYSDDYDDDLA